MKHLKIFNTQTDYNNVKTTLPLPNMCLLDDVYEIASEGDEDIVPIEYLQSTGAQWINTGIIGDLNTEIEIKFNATETSGYACGNNDTSSRAISIYIASTGNQRFGDKTYACNLPINTLHTIISNKNGITINGTTYTRTTTTEFTTAAQLYIFKGSTSATTGGKLKVYYFKVRKNGKLIADFIPVRVGTVGYLFDTVSKKLFTNAGTGSFTLGPDIIPVEYLQSTGTQYIDTEVYGYMNHTYEIDFNQTDTNNYRIWGVFGQSSYIGYNMSLTYGSGTWITRWESTSSGQAFVNIGSINTNRHKFKIVNGEVYFDDVNKGKSTSHNNSYSINYNLFLFTCNPANNSTSANSKAKIYSYKDIDDHGILVRNMIPVRIGTVGYMYDKVSRKLFANAGTGSFVVGPDDIHTKLTRSK